MLQILIRFSMNIPLNSFKLSFTVTWFKIKSLWRLICSSWAQVDSNHRPRAYQARALTSWAMSPSDPFRGWWRWAGSNRWPPACKAGALPTELHPHALALRCVASSTCFLLKVHRRYRSALSCFTRPCSFKTVQSLPFSLANRPLFARRLSRTRFFRT